MKHNQTQYGLIGETIEEQSSYIAIQLSISSKYETNLGRL